MSFNTDLVTPALYSLFSTKLVGDTVKFPDVDPVFSNGADLTTLPSINNLSGIALASYEMRSRYLFMKYAFSTETLQAAGLGTDALFQERIKYYFMSELQNYIIGIIGEGTVYKSPSLTDVTFEFNNTTIATVPVKIARAYTNIKYWFKLP